MNPIIQIFFLGFGILVAAIAINLLANFFGLETWYDFLSKISKDGFRESLKNQGLNLIFLFLVYPFLLGAIAYYWLKMLN